MQEYPAYVANNSIVNRTNYWMGIVEEKSELQDPDYEGFHNFAIAVLVVNIFFHHCILFFFLYGMQNFVREQRRKDAEGRQKCCSRLNPFRCCMTLEHAAVPLDVVERVGREMTAHPRYSGAAGASDPADPARKYSDGV